jgi:hypothetical protein
MDNLYSIFGSNIDNDLLLKLKNNSSNIKIDIHNTDHNFTINYESSNQHSHKYNKLGLQNITKIDTNNYVHYSLINDSNVIIQGKYGRQQNNINTIYFRSLTHTTDNISELLTQQTSQPYFDKYDGVYGVYNTYHKYSSILTYDNFETVAQKRILDNYIFYNQDLTIKNRNTLTGVLLHIIFNDKYNPTKYQFYNSTQNYVFPNTVNFYQVIGNNAYFIHNKTYNNSTDFTKEDTITNDTLISNELIIQIESVLISSNFFNSEIELFKAETRRQNTTELYIINANDKTNPSNYKLAVSFFGIKLLAPNTKVFNEYDIDMNDNSIQNVNTLSLKQLVLNDIIYTNIISEDNIISSINSVISTNQQIKSEIVEGHLGKYQISIYNLAQVFNPILISDIGSFHTRSNVSKNYIPYVYLNDDTSSITFEYDCNINIKYLVNLMDLETLDNTDKMLKHSNGIIYKENKLDNLTISKNLTVSSNINVAGNITINSNILNWNENIDKFTHSDGKIIQDNVLDMIRYDPIIQSPTNISFNNNYDAFTLSFSNYQHSQNSGYHIRHPYNFVNSSAANDSGIYTNYMNNTYAIRGADVECNLKINFLYLIEELDLYISSRYGNKYNKSLNSVFIIPQDNPQIIENFRPVKLFYMSNQQSNFYLDYYEYELPEKVLLHSISFYDIHFKDYSNLLNKYYDKITQDISYTAGIQTIYTFPDKNYLKHFDVLGYLNNNWELIQHISINQTNTINQYKENKINSTKKYSRYRIAFNNSSGDDITLPFIIKGLKFHVEYSKHNNNLIYNGDNVNFNIINFSINNNIRWNNIRTKFIINEDLNSIDDYYSIANNTTPYAVCHINETIDNTKLLENHMLKFGLVNNDSILPDDDYNSYSLMKDTPSVYHSLHIMNNNVYYTQSVVNKFQTIKDSDNHNEFLILVENQQTTQDLNGIVGINISKEYLCNMINNTDNNISELTGLVVNPCIRLCSFENSELKSYMDIGINNYLTLDNSYRIVLPTNSCNITLEETYYLKPTADHPNKTITTEWIPLGSEIFIKPNIYIGKPENTTIFDIDNIYCNINLNDSIETIEHLTHIRKLFIGYPELSSNIDTINKNVLTVGGSVYASHDVSTDSDISYKYNLEKIEDVRYKVEQLNGYTFDRNDTNEKRRFCGLIAQDVEKVLPEVIIRKHDGKLRVLYNNLAGLFVECFKDLYKEIDDLKKEVRSHKAEL